MAPKLTPDNITLPEQYNLDITRHEMDANIFPLPQSAGEFKNFGSGKKYIPVPALPSPFLNDRYITDIGSGSQFVKFYKDLTYQPSAVALAKEGRFNQGPIEPIPLNSKGSVQVMKSRIATEMIQRSMSKGMHEDQEIIALGTGSATPSNWRGGNISPFCAHR